MQKSTVACSIYIFDNSPWTEMNDETTEPPNHPNLSLSKDIENIWKQKHSAVGSTVKTWSLKSWEHLRTNICKYETITFNSNMWISLMRNLANNGNQPRNPHFHSEIHHLHVRRGLLDQPWMTKLLHLQSVQTCHCHRMPGKYGKVTSWHAAAFSGAHPTHQALAPSVSISLPDKSIFVTDAFVFSASAKAWKRRQSKAGVFIQGSTVQIVITEIRRTYDI